MEFTGERLVPSKFEENAQLYIEHITRYIFAEKYVKNRVVLDVGCGCGYGTQRLSQYATEIAGIDISTDAIDYCNSNHARGNINFKKMDCYHMDFPKNYFDVVVSFEVIEHLEDQVRYLDEIFRVLKEGGIFIVSTPNIVKFGKTNNPYHVNELDLDSFASLLKRYCTKVDLFGQKIDETVLLNAKVKVLKSELRELKHEMSNIYGLLAKSLIPKVLKAFLKRTVFNGYARKNEENEKLSASSYPMLMSDISITDKNISNSEYLIAVCYK